MTKPSDVTALEAKHGEKMIEVKVRFWTNDISTTSGNVLPKHAWAAGIIRMANNKSHDIKPKHPKIFHTLMDIGSVIETVLIEHEIVLHPIRKMKKYFDARLKV